MAKKYWFHAALLIVLLSATYGHSQTTAVTLQVTDTDGQTWNNGTWSTQIYSPSGVPCCTYNLAGTTTPVPGQSQTGPLSSSGGASISLTANASIVPSGTLWSFTVCPQAFPSPCYTQAFQIVGTSQNIFITPPAIRINLNNVVGRVTAYLDIEAVNGHLGSIYFNLVDSTIHLCDTVTGSTCNFISVSGGGGSGSSKWSDLLTPTGNLSLNLGTNNSLFTIGDYGASPTTGAYKITDSASTTTDTSTNLTLDTGASSRHNPVAIKIQGTNQMQVCWQAGPQGEIVIGSAIACNAISQSPFAKFLVMTNTAAHVITRLYQRSTSATGTMLEFNNATAAGTGFNFWTACTGASTTDSSCTNIVAKLAGDGSFTGTKFFSPIYTGSPSTSLIDGPGTTGIFISGGDIDMNDVAGNQFNMIGGDVGSVKHGAVTLGGSVNGAVLSSSDSRVYLNAFFSTTNTTAILDNLAFTTSVPVVAPGATLSNITGLTQCVHASSTGVLTGTGSDCNTGGGGLSGQSTLGIPIAATATTSTSSTTPGTNQGIYFVARVNSTQGTATTPVERQVGDCSGAGTITGAATTYTVLYTDVVGCNVVHDIAASAGATITLPTPTTLNNTAPIFVYSNYSASTDTLTPTTFTVSLGHTTAAASLSIPSATSCKVQLDPVNASTWKADCHPISTTGGGGGSLSGMTAGQVPIAATATTVTSSKPIQGTDANLLSSGTISGTSAMLCTDANNGATTSGCPTIPSVPTMPFYWIPYGAQGVPQVALSNQTDGTANNLVCRSFEVPNQITATKFTATVGTISAAQTFNIGIYDSSGNLIRDSGSMSAGTATQVTATVSSFTLNPGNTYAECVAITDTVAALLGSGAVVAASSMANKNATRDFACSNTLSAGAMPSTCGTATPQASKAYLVLLE